MAFGLLTFTGWPLAAWAAVKPLLNSVFRLAVRLVLNHDIDKSTVDNIGGVIESVKKRSSNVTFTPLGWASERCRAAAGADDDRR
jgi:hypothetical protein